MAGSIAENNYIEYMYRYDSKLHGYKRGIEHTHTHTHRQKQTKKYIYYIKRRTRKIENREEILSYINMLTRERKPKNDSYLKRSWINLMRTEQHKVIN